MGNGEVMGSGMSKKKGLRNKRKRKVRIQKEMVMEADLVLQRAKEKRESEMSDEWRDYVAEKRR